MTRVMICGKCGRGIIGKEAKRTAVVDGQPIWWTQDSESERCGGRLIIVDRMAQIEMLYAETIVPAAEQEAL